MKTLLLSLISCGLAGWLTSGRAADALTEELQRGVLAEEVNRDLTAAVQAYRAVISQHDEQSRVVATALYRLGECQRKLGQTNEAIGAYQRLLRDYPGEAALARLSRENLAAFGLKPPANAEPTPAALPAAARLSAADADSLREEIKLVEQERLTARKRVENGKGTPDEVRQAELESLRLQRQLPENAARARQVELVKKEVTLAEQALAEVKAKIQVGVVPPLDEVPARRALLGLQRELRAAEALPEAGAPSGRTVSASSPTDAPNAEEAIEIARLQTLFRNSPDLINAPGRNDLTPLQSAASLGQLGVTRFLLDQGADANGTGTDKGSLTPLHYAALNGHKAVVELLLARGADVNAGNAGTPTGVTALHLAVNGGHRAVVQSLLAAKPDLDAVSTSIRPFKGRPDPGLTPLMVAIRNRSVPLVEALLAAGAGVNKTGTAGSSPLMVACERGPVAVVELLLRAKAEVNQRDPNGGTALHAAVGGDQPEIIALLLARGAEVNTSSTEGYTPAHTAALSRSTATVAALLKARPDLNRLTQGGLTPLHLALGGRASEEGGNPEIVRLLMEGGADINRPIAATGRSPLHLAVQRNSVELCQVVLAGKPNLETQDNDGLTPLQQAASREKSDLVRLLLEAGANPNPAFWQGGDRPLHWAARRGDEAMVQLLLQHGADVNALNEAGQTPLSMLLGNSDAPQPVQRPGTAARNNRVIELLRKAGADESFHLRDAISVRRPNGVPEIVFRRQGSDRNRFTLLETIAVLYGGNRGVRSGPGKPWAFPDFARITLIRLVEGQPKPSRLDAAAILESRDPGRDVPLAWGDLLEIPEADHPVEAEWGGLSEAAIETLSRAVSRRVTVVVQGESKTIALTLTNGQAVPTLAGRERLPGSLPSFDPSKDAFWLPGAVLASRMVRTSSDLSRVRVKRTDPRSG